MFELLDIVTPQAKEDVLEDVLPNVFLFGHLIPQCAIYGFDSGASVFVVAREIWGREANEQKRGKDRNERIITSVKVKVKDLMMDTQVQPL